MIRYWIGIVTPEMIYLQWPAPTRGQATAMNVEPETPVTYPPRSISSDVRGVAQHMLHHYQAVHPDFPPIHALQPQRHLSLCLNLLKMLNIADP